mmetsp:Transcript_25739/g.60699  ORF Transcript_25739/g.60699 Transcript_25739/m.60699 type:complete len:213 (+) Transcript_25739:73-711(+)
MKLTASHAGRSATCTAGPARQCQPRRAFARCGSLSLRSARHGKSHEEAFPNSASLRPQLATGCPAPTGCPARAAVASGRCRAAVATWSWQKPGARILAGYEVKTSLTPTAAGEPRPSDCSLPARVLELELFLKGLSGSAQGSPARCRRRACRSRRGRAAGPSGQGHTLAHPCRQVAKQQASPAACPPPPTAPGAARAAPPPEHRRYRPSAAF